MTNDFLAIAPVSAVPAAGFSAALPAGLSAAMPADPMVVVPADPAVALLDEMMARVGVDGLTAALADPGLLAHVDQHAAAVREALREAGREVDAEGLASYAKSIVFAARRMGRPVPEIGAAYETKAAWHAAEWHLMRLVAVCAIAESSGLL
jgi:hypothetical protein